MVRGWNPGGGDVFHSHPDRPLGPPSFLYSGYRVFPGVNRRRRGIDHLLPSSAKVEGKVELYICYPSGHSWPVLGLTYHLPVREYAKQHKYVRGPGSSVGIATGYRLDGPGIESWWG
jgi:hypothetical protein